ncbi:MAG: GGDEF domain-containing protein [Gammaproteobacteria bacterium]|nr:MAG: GGDEF domain-containing protein [Gammaproteobacteria bacterium]
MPLKSLRVQPRRRCSTIQVIDSIAEVTRYLDKELIEQSLLSTLSEFEPEQELRLYKVYNHEPELEIGLSALYSNGVISCGHANSRHEIEPGLSSLMAMVVESGELSSVQDPESGCVVSLYPVFDQDGDLYSLLTQIGPPVALEDQRMIDGLLRIYANYLSLLDLSQKDKLTSLLNRDRLQTTILQILGDQRLTQGARHHPKRRAYDQQKHWLALIDIDHFKRINDAHGHLMGDEILIIFARLMHEVFRNDDLLFRFGGEEFVAIIRADDKEKAGLALERFRSRVDEYDFPLAGHLTASIGVTEIDGQDSPEAVIEAADKAMYYVKQHGRNRVAFYGDLVECGEVEPLPVPRSGDIDLF